jgi:hypothetical protein
MDPKHLFIISGVLFVLSVLFMRNTHPYSGRRSEKFESKQLRRRIGIVCLVLSIASVAIGVLTHMLISRG